MSRLSLRLTPHGRLIAEAAENTPEIDDAVAARLGSAFAQGSGAGLLWLGAGEVGQALPPVFVWWRAFAARYVAALCLHAPAEARGEKRSGLISDVPVPGDGDFATLVLTAPMMSGAEYLTAEVLRRLWDEIAQAASASFATARTDLQSFLKGLNPAWNLVGR